MNILHRALNALGQKTKARRRGIERAEMGTAGRPSEAKKTIIIHQPNKVMKIILKALVIISILSCGTPHDDVMNEISVLASFSPETEQVLQKFALGLPSQVVVFAFIKAQNGGVSDLILLARKPNKADFANIGIPLYVLNLSNTKFLFYTGFEQFLLHNQPFTVVEGLKISENDPENQDLNIIDTPIVKSARYRIQNKTITLIPGPISDLVFIPPPTRDTVKFKK